MYHFGQPLLVIWFYLHNKVLVNPHSCILKIMVFYWQWFCCPGAVYFSSTAWQTHLSVYVWSVESELWLNQNLPYPVILPQLVLWKDGGWDIVLFASFLHCLLVGFLSLMMMDSALLLYTGPWEMFFPNSVLSKLILHFLY